MKLCIFSNAIGEIHSGHILSLASINRYAKICNADFIVNKKIVLGNQYTGMEKFLMYKMLEKYDRILYLDTDILIHPCALDIFKTLDENPLPYMFNESFTNREYDLQVIRRRLKEVSKINPKLTFLRKKLENEEINYYYNAGVILINQENKDFLVVPDGEFFLGNGNEENGYHLEQTLLNYLQYRNDIFIADLPVIFNKMDCHPANRQACCFIHYAGAGYTQGTPYDKWQIMEFDADNLYGRQLKSDYEYVKERIHEECDSIQLV